MPSIIDVLSILPLFLMCLVQVTKVAIPTFQASKEERMDLNAKLNKEHCLDGLIGIVDGVACLWFIASLVYLHNYEVDAWHNAEAFWTLKVIATIWLCVWLNKQGHLKFTRPKNHKKSTSKDSNKE